MASALAFATAKLAKLRRVASGVLAIIGTMALTATAVRQYGGHGFQAHELWFLGLLLAVTLEAIASFLRPEAVGVKVSIWSLTLMGCSCVFGGFVMRQGLILALGGAMILTGYVMAVFEAPAKPGRPGQTGGG
jgi:hypothetical protein